MADFKIVVIKDGKPTNLTSGDAAEAPSLTDGTTVISGGTITGSSSITATTLTDGTASINLGAISGATTIDASGAATVGSLDASSGGITNAGAISGATTIGASGAATVGSLDAGSGAIATTGTLSSGAATVTSLDATNGGITQAGAISGATTIGASGAATVGSLDAGSGAIATTGTLSSGAATVTSLDVTNGGISNTGAVSGVTTLTTTGDVTIGGNAGVSGDLTVQGDIISRGSVDIVVEDQFLELGNNNVSTTPFAGGYVQVNAKAGDLVFVAESFTNPDTIQLTTEGDASPTFKTASIQITALINDNGGAGNPSFGIDDRSGSAVTFTFGADFSGVTIAAQANALATAINGNAEFRAVSNEVDTVIIQYPDVQSGGAGAIVFNLNGGGGTATTQNFGGNPQLPQGTVVMISGLTDNAGNNGLYVVDATGQNVNNGTITIDTSPANAVQWCQNDLATATEEGSVTLVQLYVQAVSDGVITDSSAAAIAQGTLSDSFQTFASEANFTDGYAVVGASAVSTTLQDAYDNGSGAINNTNLANPFAVTGAGTITLTSSDDLSFNSSSNGAVQNVGLSNQTASVDLHATDNTNSPSFSLLANNDSAISIVTDLGQEAQLTIGSYIDSSPQAGSIGSVKIAADRLYNTVRFNAGAAVSSGDAVAVVEVIDQASVTVDTVPLNNETFVLDSFGGTTYTITFTTTDQISDTTFTGGAATISTAAGRDDSVGSIAHAMAVLYNSVTDLNANNNAAITVSAVPGASETLVLNGYAGQNYTITFQNGGGTDATWSGAGPFTANIDITVDNTANDVADAIATLYNAVDGGSGDVTASAQGDRVEVSNTDLTNQLNITDTTGGDLNLDFKSGLVADNIIVADSLVFTDAAGNFTVDPDSVQGVVVSADSTTANSRTSFVGIAFEAGAAGDTIDVVIGGTRTVNILTADQQSLTAGGSLYLSATAGDVGTSPSASGQTIFQVGVAISGVNVDTGTAICLIQPMFIAEIA